MHEHHPLGGGALEYFGCAVIELSKCPGQIHSGVFAGTDHRLWWRRLCPALAPTNYFVTLARFFQYRFCFWFMWRAFWHARPTYSLSYVPPAVHTGRNAQYPATDFCMYSIFTDCL